MFRPRIIPVLLIQKEAAVKTKQFSAPKYLGDIINTARLFSEMHADELIVLDIDASRTQNVISSEIVKEISSETSMPLSAGGGITSLSEIEQLVASGAEKIILGCVANTNEAFVKEAVNQFGSSTISVCLDIKAGELYYQNATIKVEIPLIDKVNRIIDSGVGELIVQSVDRDGMRSGYDIESLAKISTISPVPVVALGGAHHFDDIEAAFKNTNCSAFGASSMFVLHKNGVLISYPEKSQLRKLLNR